MTATGRQHEIEPDGDSLSFIDFEDAEVEGGQRLMDLSGVERAAWHREMVGHVVFEVTGGPANVAGGQTVLDLYRDTLMLTATDPAGLNEVALWENVARWANGRGFDTYNSDSRFELFPGGTPVSE